MYIISLYNIYTVDKLLTSTMYEKMDGKGIPLWFLQSVRQSPGQSWDARGGFGHEFLKAFGCWAPSPLKPQRNRYKLYRCLHLSSEKKKNAPKPPFSCNYPFHSNNFHPRPRCRGPKYLHWTNDQRVPAPDPEAFSPVRGPTIPQETQKSGQNLMNFWSKRPRFKAIPLVSTCFY